jgi:hypothetical protein
MGSLKINDRREHARGVAAPHLSQVLQTLEKQCPPAGAACARGKR